MIFDVNSTVKKPAIIFN